MSKQDKTSYGDEFTGQEPTREEQLSINLKFDYAKYLPVADTIAQLCGWEPDLKWALVPGDGINFNYSFEVHYFGEVEKRLNQVVTLLTHLDSDIVVKVDSNMLDEASCLFLRAAKKLQEVKTIIDIREGTD